MQTDIQAHKTLNTELAIQQHATTMEDSPCQIARNTS